jgi:TRAP-type transport system periplasmic protein
MLVKAALFIAAIVGAPILASSSHAQQAVTLHGAVQFNDDHAFNKALLKFQELVKSYYGKPIEFVLHRNSELGLEKDYFAYMNQGISVDYGIVSPAHMSTFSKAAPFIDAPFLFRNLAEMKGLKVRVQGAPIWSRTFAAIGMSPTVIAYNEIYNAIQNGVIAAGENEAAGVEQMKFFEVGPHLSMTEHAITIRPICFSGKTFKKLPPDLQAAVLKAGKEAGAHGRQIESSEDSAKLDALEKAGKLKRVPFSDRAEMKKLVDPVMAAYAKEIGADAIYARINDIK